MVLVLIAFFAACPLIGLSLARLDSAFGPALTERWRERALAAARTLRPPR